VYPRWVSKGKMKKAEADYEIACMKDVERTLEKLAIEEPILGASHG